MKDELPRRGGRVDLFREGLEGDFLLFQFVHDLHQVGKVASQAIEAPDREGIAGAKGSKTVFEFGPRGILAARLFPVDVLAPGTEQGIKLKVKDLIFGGDPCVAYFHI